MKLSKQLNIGQLFGPEANFSRLCHQAVLGELRHHTVIDFGETGIHAKSRTVAVGIPKSGATEIVFEATHPFFFEILEAEDVLLFSGLMTNPKAE